MTTNWPRPASPPREKACVDPELLTTLATSSSPLHTQRTVERSIDGERLIGLFSRLVDPLGASLGPDAEVVLHDLSLIPNSIVAIHGSVTGRSVGDPATDLLLQQAATGYMDVPSYTTTLDDGREIASSTMIIRCVRGNPVAALCVNRDVTMWRRLSEFAAAAIGASPAPAAHHEATSVIASGAATDDTDGTPRESFVHDVDELAALLIHNAIAAAGVPVELMKKKHKVDVVRQLKSHGLFLLRDGVELVATSLNVTRFSIYNYLTEISEDEAKTDIEFTA